jgi:hypothetical protein
VIAARERLTRWLEETVDNDGGRISSLTFLHPEEPTIVLIVSVREAVLKWS